MAIDLSRGTEQALAALGMRGDSIAYDPQLDAEAVAAALAAGHELLMRAGAPLGEGAGDQGPEPRDGVWLLIDPRAHRLRVAPLLSAEEAKPGQPAVRRISLHAAADLCCDAPKCDRRRERWSVSIEVDRGGPFIALETADRQVAHALARALSGALSVSCEPHIVADEPAEGASTAPLASWTLTAAEVARWSLRCEAGRWVVRDRASRGPREALARELALACALVASAAILAWLAWRNAAAAGFERAAIYGVCALVMVVASYAVAHIAAHSARYRADGAPVLFAYRDRFVPAPWVARNGALKLGPEGRYGAALPIPGVERVEVETDGTRFALVCHGEHGPIELGVFESQRLAVVWRQVLTRLLRACAHSALVALAVLLVGCHAPAHPIATNPTTNPTTTATTTATTPATTPATTTTTATTTATATASAALPPLPMIENDVPKALARAKAEKKIAVVDVWAAWCHTCLSMRSFVLNDPAIAALDDRVVFASVDSEAPANADFMQRYRVGVWPTFFALDDGGAVLGLWEGSASVAELRRFITAAADQKGAASDRALAALVAGMRAQAAGKCTVAAHSYQRALEKGGAGWARRGEAEKGLIFCDARERRWKECLDLGVREIGAISGVSAPADFAAQLLECARSAQDRAAADQARALVVARLKQLTGSPPAGASVDDRADALATLAAALAEIGDRDGARQTRQKQLALLERAAAAAPNAEMAATFDYQRMNAYFALGEGDKALAMLQERCRLLPDHFEPFARLAEVAYRLGRLDEALASIDKALGMVQGPRRIRYLELKADIFAAMGKKPAERQALTELAAAYRALPRGAKQNPNNVDGLAAATARLRALK